MIYDIIPGARFQVSYFADKVPGYCTDCLAPYRHIRRGSRLYHTSELLLIFTVEW